MQHKFIQVKLQEDEFLLVKVTAMLLGEKLNAFVRRVLIKECSTANTGNIQNLVKTSMEGGINDGSK